MASKKQNIFETLKNRAKDRTSVKTYTLEDEELGTLTFKLRPVTLDDILKASDGVPSFFAGIRGQDEGDEPIDEEEQISAVLKNMELSRTVFCLAAKLEGPEEGVYLSIVDKPAEDCADDEMPLEAFDNNQIAEIAAEIMGRIRFR